MARRSLLDARQRLGVLPTLWFWNDWEQQRLLLPITLLVAVPLGPLLVFGAGALGAPVGLGLAVCGVVPILVMGLVERRVRATLGRGDSVELTTRSQALRRSATRRVLTLLGVVVAAAVCAALAGASLAELLALSLLAAPWLAWLLAPAIRERMRRLRASSRRSLSGSV